MTWLWFTDSERCDLFPREDRSHHAAAHVNDLRGVAARRSGDADVEALVRDLPAVSTEFTELRHKHEVATRHYDRKRIVHPEVGLIHVTGEILLTPTADVEMLVFFPTERTDAHEKLALLRVIGSQDLSPIR